MTYTLPLSASGAKGTFTGYVLVKTDIEPLPFKGNERLPYAKVEGWSDGKLIQVVSDLDASWKVNSAVERIIKAVQENLDHLAGSGNDGNVEEFLKGLGFVKM